MKKLLFIILIITNSFSAEFNIKENQKLCENNNKKACYVLGDYLLSKGVVSLAKTYFSKACSLNMAEACYSLEKIEKF